MFKKTLGIAVLLITFAFIIPHPAFGGLPVVSIQPHTSRVWGTGEVFTVNVTVADVTDLYGWEAKLYYDSSILSCKSVSEGSFLKNVGSTFFNFTINDNYNPAVGRVEAFNTLLGQIPGVSGEGVLLSVTFETKELGIAILDLENTILSDINANVMPHIVVDGGVEVISAVRDVAIKGISTSSDTIVSGHVLEIYVTAANMGNKTETFDVASYYNETLIAVQTVTSLSPQSNVMITFTLNTSFITPNATITIKAEASSVPDEIDLENNVFVYGVVYVTQGVHDVAVIDVRPALYEVYEGETLNIYVTVANKGDYSETFNVTVYRDDVPIGIQTVENLMYGRTQELTFIWDTKGVAPNRTYTIRASASAVAGETQLADNSLVDGDIAVYPYVTLSIRIAEVVPCNELGQPVSSFLAGTVANFKVTLDCSMIGAKTILLTVNVQDAKGNTMGVASFQGPVTSGMTTFILGLPIPTTANVGTARVYANALSDWPHLGGKAYCQEVTAAFEIRR